MPIAEVASGVELCYETLGSRHEPPLLLVMGLGAQMISWPDELCQTLADRGFFVVRFDNRDCGLSTKPETARVDIVDTFLRALGGEEVTAPYLLRDMANDAVGLLDVLGIESAHVVGISLGGMIAQTIAIEHRARVRTLTSIMSTTGDRDVGLPHAEALPVLLSPPPSTREGFVDKAVASARVIGSPGQVDEAYVRALAGRSFDRCFFPLGVGRQLLAIAASGSRSDELRRLDVPTLVMHGDRDALIDVSGGHRTAEVIPGAELVILEGLGHDLPRAYWEQVLDGICKIAARA
jgi:pimeloyl-ACP methyl ester carboxylesterase